MKQKLSFKEYIYVASMLFGMFFGAGNLIFPVYMGQRSTNPGFRQMIRSWLSDHRRGPASAGRGCLGHQPQQRPF